LGVAVLLTRAEIQKLRGRAASDLRSVASYATWLVAQHLGSPVGRRSAGSVPGVGPGDRRTLLRISLVMPAAMANRLKTRAKAEMRSVSGYVASVIVEALARHSRNQSPALGRGPSLGS
jgi:hypothetical protein